MRSSPLATSLIIGSTCFFLGILFAMFPYDYPVLWTTPEATVGGREPYFAQQENHLKVLHASPPLIPRILHIVVGTGLLGFVLKLYKPNEANMLFDGASLVLYMCGTTVYITNIVRGLRTVTEGKYGEDVGEGYIGREDSLRVVAASNAILALVLLGVLVLQLGQWYAQRKEDQEMAEMDRQDQLKKSKKKA
ncbi:Shr3 amino acid permease chaperone [Piedraia hortae CBS 480.64]|uniref:Shr3 amino acid permease chaperone n=1 Tax=Piedraia hortae CBS 480.64 TaxID=1314780 RepID=A0A6A7C7X1_9PEZI|nr:Shr3 amino acid permease chaperone [Piedraia hortae CBS 480.64]